MKSKLTRIYTRLNDTPFTPEDIAAIQRANASLPFKGGHVVAYRTNASKGSVLMQAWRGDSDGSVPLRNRSGKFVRTGVSPYTLCEHLDNGRSLIE